MPSLSEAYSDQRGRSGGRDPRRVALGAGVSLTGAGMLLTALFVLTTPLAGLLGASEPLAAKHLAGILAGLGGTAIQLGVVVVLPSKRRQQLGVVVGSLIALAGVALFSYAFPTHWIRSANPLVFETAIVFFVGSFVSLWFVFVALANFRRRNDPPGTISLEVETAGETHRYEVSQAEFQRYKSIVSDGGSAEDIISEIEANRED